MKHGTADTIAFQVRSRIELFMAMVIQMDASGRLVLPKPVREALNITGPASFTAEIVGGRLELTPAALDSVAGLKDKGGMRVLARTGVPVDAGAAVRADRHSRG